ncbi:MAG: ATP-binding protein [Bacteroidota bacterium]|nr:ATP-binding protein [Bacteroidota bacterium]
MFSKPRAIALLLAFSIASITTAFLSLVNNVPVGAFLVAYTISFSATYILSNVILDFLFFKEINKIYGLLDKVKKKDLSHLEEVGKPLFNPLQRLNQEIYTYASLKQREIDELKRLAKFRKEFLADVSHELKTPIFAAQGFIHTLLDGAVEDETVRMKFLQKAAKNLDGLDNLVQDLLTLSHMETGEIKMNIDTFNIYDLTQEVFDQVELKAGKKQMNMNFVSDCEKKVYVKADQQRIYQVMLNLISNAVKYTKEGGKVTVDFKIERGEVITSVKDTGRGIPPEDIKRIFERFYRVEKSRSRDKGGTGLGLAIVKHILEAHNSKIQVSSTVGKGSTFSFKLPKGKIEEKVKNMH